MRSEKRKGERAGGKVIRMSIRKEVTILYVGV